MSKFKVGDKVKRVSDSHLLVVGEVREVVVVEADGWLRLEGYGGKAFDPLYFELAEDTSKRRPHYDLIIAWANGAEIQCLQMDTWYDRENPTWGEGAVYRVKPTNPEKEKLEQLISDMDKQLTDAKNRLKEIAGE